MGRSAFIYVLPFLLLVSFSCSAINISFGCETFDQDREALYVQMPYPLLVEQITIDADVPIDRQEIFYLLGITPGMSIDAECMERAVERLIQKNRFKKITLISDEAAPGFLRFFLEAAWTLNKVKLHDISFGKASYRQCYLIEQGDFFDLKKHMVSLKKIGELMYANGYFCGSIKDTINRFPLTKTVEVHLSCKLSTRFSIRKINLNLNSAGASAAVRLPLQEDIYKQIQALQGCLYDKKVITQKAECIKNILIQKGFFQSQIILEELLNKKNATVDLVWSINIGPSRGLEFLGNHFFSSKQLLDHITQFGRSIVLIPHTILAQEIVQLYKSSGFLEVSVDGADQKEGSSTFIINEGSRFIIDQVRLYNVHSFDNLFLQKKCFAELIRLKYAHEKKITDAIENLLDLYVEAGFFDVRIVNRTLKILGPSSCCLELTIEEGSRYSLANVYIAGFSQLSSKIFDDKQIQYPYVTVDLIKQQEQLIRHNFNQLNCHIIRLYPEFIKQGENTVTIVWHVKTRGTVHFGKTIVIANDKQPFSYIMKMCTYKEGQIWDQQKLRETFVALKDLSIFDSITIVPSTRTVEGQRDVLIRVNFDDPFELRLRAGLELLQVEKYRTFGGIAFRGGGTFIVKNPAQAGDCLTFDADIGRFDYEITGKYRYPWPFGFPVRLELQLYNMFYDQPSFSGALKNIYGIRQHGFLASIDKSFSCVTLNLTSGIELCMTGAAACSEKDFICATNLAQAINFDTSLLGKNIPFFFAEQSCFIDYLDNKLNPQSGFYTLGSCKLMLPFQETKTVLFKGFIESAYFIPIKNIVLALRARAGHIWFSSFKAISPAERFYLGGSHSLRGYDADMAPPLGFFDDKGKEVVVPRGGKSMFNINAELRIPVVTDLDGVLFSDLGALAGDSWTSLRSEGILGTSGFGIRFRTPVGPLRFDIGWKWHRKHAFERSYAWYLTFGQSF